MDHETTLMELKKAIEKFTNDRDWAQFHNPKDLSLGLVIEVAEILEHFRFKTNAEIEEYLTTSENKKELSHEIADTFWFLLRLADVLDIDLSTALQEKMKLAADKYPIDKVKGLSHKYTYYQNSNNEEP